MSDPLDPILSSVGFILVLAVAVLVVAPIADALRRRRLRQDEESLGPRLGK